MRTALDLLNSARRLWPRLAPRFETRGAAVLLFGIAEVLYWLEAQAWPFQRGRDAWDYLTYYLSLLDRQTPFPDVMLVRTPVTPLLLGVPMQLGGALALEVAFSILFALAVVAWAAAAVRFSRVGALAFVAVLFAYPGFGQVFHETGSEAVASFGFALWVLLIVRSAERPSWRRFAAIGAGVALLGLTRPSYVVLGAAVLLPLALPGAWRQRLAWGASCAACVALPLLAWAGVNKLRYGVFSISRLGAATVPFYGPFGAGEINPANGPASRQLARLVRKDVLQQPAYRSLQVTPAAYLRSGSNFEWVRLVGLNDRLYGRGSGFSLLHRAGEEAIAREQAFHLFGLNVLDGLQAFWAFLSQPVQFTLRDKPTVWPEPPPSERVGRTLLPNPAALPPPLQAITYGTLWCASNELSRCVLRQPSLAYRDPALARRYSAVMHTLERWDASLGRGQPNRWLFRQLYRVAAHFPPPWFWLALAAAALLLRRPRRGLLLVALLGFTGLILLIHAEVIGNIAYFAVPAMPTLFFGAICALSGARAARRRG